jgi:hypothetical protein
LTDNVRFPAIHALGDLCQKAVCRPLNGIGWLERIEAYTDPSSQERQAQLKRLESFVQPKWSGHFHMVEELMERLGYFAAA